MKQSIKILVLCDDYWHPARVPRAGLDPLSEFGYAFDFVESAHDWSPALMAAYPAVILTKSNDVTAVDRTQWMTDDAQTAFVDYVAQGNGLLAIHSGTAGYEEARQLRRLLGGVFTHHPEQCQVTVKLKAEHPLTANSESFTILDEHYFMAFDADDADLFMTTKTEDSEQPGGWRRGEGKGRVAVLTPGHNLDVWYHPSYQAIIQNCLRWCTGLS
jgi:type 1 glutamine amidotransferase